MKYVVEGHFAEDHSIDAPSDRVFDDMSRRAFTWIPSLGMGRLALDGSQPYDSDYFDKYKGYAATERGRKITEARVAFVNNMISQDDAVIDIGIGCGAFVEARKNTYGFDVNTIGIDWLVERGLWADPYSIFPEVVTLWDVLEHIPNPSILLERVRGYVFTCLPIFRDLDHVMRSRHYRPDEHCWYWTRSGLLKWMEEQGFRTAAHSRDEIVLGREDIETFAFRRVR